MVWFTPFRNAKFFFLPMLKASTGITCNPTDLAHLCVYVCLCSQVTGMRNCSNLLLSPEEHLSCRRNAGEMRCAPHRQPWHSLVLWHELLWMTRRPQIPLQCHLCVFIGVGCDWHAGRRQMETLEKQPLQSRWIRKSHVVLTGTDKGPVDDT